MIFLPYASWMEVRVTENNFEREHLRIIYAMFATELMTHPNTLPTMVHGEAISINIWHHTTTTPLNLQNRAGIPLSATRERFISIWKEKKE